MVIRSQDNEDLTIRDLKYLLGSFAVITAATVIGLYIYNDVLKMHWTRRTEQYYGQMNSTSRYNYRSPETEHIENHKEYFPKLELEIITSEYDDENNIWRRTLGHTFYSDTEDEIIGLVNAHRQTDTFFDASFSGIFEWKGGTIKLKNTVYDLTYK